MTAQTELEWVGHGRAKIGTLEVKGAKHNPVIVAMWELSLQATKQKTWIRDDETAWCGAFTAYCMARAGLDHHIPKTFYRAKDWANVGTALNKPAYGCIVVFNRSGGGHVGIVVGIDKNGNLMVLGGNQSDKVSIVPFNKNRVLAYRWCGTQKLPASFRFNLPLLESNGRVSTNEA